MRPAAQVEKYSHTEDSMARIGEGGRKKVWTKPTLRKLNLSDDQIKALFGEHVTNVRRKRQVGG